MCLSINSYHFKFKFLVHVSEDKRLEKLIGERKNSLCTLTINHRVQPHTDIII